MGARQVKTKAEKKKTLSSVQIHIHFPSPLKPSLKLPIAALCLLTASQEQLAAWKRQYPPAPDPFLQQGAAHKQSSHARPTRSFGSQHRAALNSSVSHTEQQAGPSLGWCASPPLDMGLQLSPQHSVAQQSPQSSPQHARLSPIIGSPGSSGVEAAYAPMPAPLSASMPAQPAAPLTHVRQLLSQPVSNSQILPPPSEAPRPRIIGPSSALYRYTWDTIGGCMHGTLPMGMG